jgi:hypothetical protein
MLNTYIKNRGSTKTIIHDKSNSHKYNNLTAVNELKWDADYDGDIANISITSDTNGEKKHFDISLDNNDLEHILNIPSVNTPIHKRLQMDFSEPDFRREEPTIYRVELPQIELPLQSIPFENRNQPKIKTLEQIFDSPNTNRYLSTPLPNEELIIPAINKKDKLTRRRSHKKTHKTYRVHKKHKTNKHKLSTRKSGNKFLSLL